MTRPRLLVAVAVALLLCLLPAGAAHGITPAPELPFRVLLADRTDDCGPEVGGAQDCHGSDALIGLTLQEKWDGSQDQMVFRFYLDKGKTYPVSDVLTLNTPGGAKTLAIHTTDDSHFDAAGGDFESVGNAQAIPGQGTRFLVDAVVSFSKLGVSAGDALSNFKVESKSGSTVGDFMPGGCHNTIGDCTAPDDGTYIAGGGSGTFTLEGPSYYVGLEAPQSTAVGAGQESIAQLSLSNKFRTVAQTVTLTVSGADGVTARFHNPSNNQYSDTLTQDLDKGASTSIHVAIQGDHAGASGTLKVTVTTNLGGRAQVDVPYTVGDAGSSSDGGDSTADTTTKAKGSPGLAFPALLTVLAAVALSRRRA